MKVLHVCLIVAFLAACSLATAQTSQPATFTEGQKVEVREGDTWSAATIIKKEGRRYQIRYAGDAATDEWVTIDRIRAAGVGTPTSGVAPTSSPATPQAKADVWTVNQKVEVKWGGMWSTATIVKLQGEWYQVKYDAGKSLEWVEPWRIRKIGSTEDKIGYGSINHGNTPPREKVGPPPEKVGAAPAHAASANPFKDPGIEAFKDDPAYRNAKWPGAATIAMPAPGGWNLTLASSPTSSPAVAPVANGLIAPNGNAGDRSLVGRVTFCRGGRAAFVQRDESGKVVPSIERVDLAAHKSIGSFAINPGTRLIAAAPDGKSLLVRSDGFFPGNSERLELWAGEGLSVKRIAIWFPYGDQGSECDIQSAIFIDSTNILTVSKDGRLGLWDANTVKTLWTAQAKGGSAPALSADGKYLAVSVTTGFMIIEALTGKAVGHIPASDASGQLVFSPSGRQLAAWDGRNMRVWDMTTGKLFREFTVGNGNGQSITVPADGYALFDDGTLVDFERRIPLWHYKDGRNFAATADGQVCFHRGSGVMLLASVPTPDALAAAKALNADDLLLLKPGVKVSLDLSAAGNDAGILEHLKKELTDRGMIVADGEPIRIVVKVEVGKTEKMYFRPIGAGATAAPQEIQVTPQFVKIVIESGGKSAWETSSGFSAGSMLSLKAGQSAQQAADEATKPNFSFLKTIQLPAYLTKPHTPAWYGESSLR